MYGLVSAEILAGVLLLLSIWYYELRVRSQSILRVDALVSVSLGMIKKQHSILVVFLFACLFHLPLSRVN